MAKKAKRQPAKGSRFQIAHDDGAIQTTKNNIEKVFGLPSGSVQLIKYDGTPIRSNAKVGTLRKDWA